MLLMYNNVCRNEVTFYENEEWPFFLYNFYQLIQLSITFYHYYFIIIMIKIHNKVFLCNSKQTTKSF